MEVRVIEFGGRRYSMDECGNVHSLYKNKTGYIKTFPDKDGYLKFTVCVQGKTYNAFIHRLVYKTFVGDIPDGMTVDHIDSDKLNNHYLNLQIMTGTENVIKGNARYWVVTDPNGVVYEVYNLSKFCRDHGLHRTHMYEVAAGYKNQTQHKGWKVYEQY